MRGQRLNAVNCILPPEGEIGVLFFTSYYLINYFISQYNKNFRIKIKKQGSNFEVLCGLRRRLPAFIHR